jgi:hypothetical protein
MELIHRQPEGIRSMTPKLSIGMLEKRRDAKLKRLATVGPLLQGSLAEIRVTCGNPNCRCARGQKHRSHILKRQIRGKTQSLYVPVDMVQEAHKWVEEHRRVKRLLKEISELNRSILKAYVPTKRARAANRAAAERASRQSRSKPSS